MSCLDEKLERTIVGAMYVAEELIATLRTPDDWSRFYDKYLGPEGFAALAFPEGLFHPMVRQGFIHAFNEGLSQARIFN